jgi:outer membrane protein
MSRYIATVLACIIAFPAAAAITREVTKEAIQLMDSDRAPEAFLLLSAHHEPAKAGPQELFLLGMAAKKSGRCAEALRYFKLVLAHDAASHRARLEMVECLHESGEAAKARELLLEVKASSPPARVVENIDRYLSMMNDRTQQGSAWRTRGTVGAGYDSNPGAATSARSVGMFGLPFALSDTARERGAGFAFVKGEFDHIYRFDPQFAWMSSASFNARKHSSFSDYDNFAANVSTGAVWQPNMATTVLLPAFADVARFETPSKNSDQRWYSWELGLAPQVRYAVLSSLDLNLATIAGRRLYFNDENRDATIASVSPSIDLKTPNAGTVTIGATIGREAAHSAMYANRSIGVNVGWQYAFTKTLVSSTYGIVSNIQYDAPETIYAAYSRQDQRTIVGLDLIYSWALIQSDLLLSYAHTWNESNLAIYTYDRDMVSVALRKTF